MRYSHATVGISVGADGGIWLSVFSETHMANHSSLKTLDRDSVCVVKGMARVLDDCIQVEKKLPLLVLPIWENVALFATKSS